MSYLTSKVVQRIAKELVSLHKDKIDDIDVLAEENLENISEINAIIHGPQGTPYEGGQFVVKLTFCEEFPTKPPKGYFVTKIFHPNVSREGDICVNTLKRDWKPSNTLRHVLLVIRCLMIEPNPDSALNADAGRLIQENYEAFASKAKMMTDIYAKKKKEGNVAQSTVVELNTSAENAKENNINTNNVVLSAESKVGAKAKTVPVIQSSGMTKTVITGTASKDKKKNLKRL